MTQTIAEWKAKAEAAQWQAAHEWAEELDVNLQGVNLAEAMVYDALRVLGRLALRYLPQKESSDEPSSGAPD